MITLVTVGKGMQRTPGLERAFQGGLTTQGLSRGWMWQTLRFPWFLTCPPPGGIGSHPSETSGLGGIVLIVPECTELLWSVGTPLCHLARCGAAP